MKEYHISLSASATTLDAIKKYKKENESLDEAALRLLNERLNALEVMTDEQYTLESISTQLFQIHRMIFNIGMRIPLPPP